MIDINKLSGLNEKNCYLLAREEDRIHISWLIDDKMISFEYVPENSPSYNMFVFNSENEYKQAVADIGWINHGTIVREYDK